MQSTCKALHCPDRPKPTQPLSPFHPVPVRLVPDPDQKPHLMQRKTSDHPLKARVRHTSKANRCLLFSQTPPLPRSSYLAVHGASLLSHRPPKAPCVLHAQYRVSDA
ncbi:hypothetical protein B0T16DRAFT_412382 [Cercophora newfieldiana]|uniref:Uncharacterized protein n=1 Tax=Cercophora newfieldiana TaxID=92897 RepID=A0AA39Y4P6_9PEZI|nr:hypothetical protein B0T16DRAFT_412382 [Cercophora newfieldiana]